MGVPVVELHTGAFCEAFIEDPDGESARAELSRLQEGARHAERLGIECHAGHGITFDSVGPIARIPGLTELNIGHFLIGEAIYVGLEQAIRRMRGLMDEARGKGKG